MSFCKLHHHLKLAELAGCKGDYHIARLDAETLNPKLPDLSQVSLRLAKYEIIHSDKIAKGNAKKFVKNGKVFIVG